MQGGLRPPGGEGIEEAWEHLNWTQMLGGVWLANGRGGEVGGGSCLNGGREVGHVFGRQGARSTTAFLISSHPFSNRRTLQGPDIVRSSPRRVTWKAVANGDAPSPDSCPVIGLEEVEGPCLPS